MKVSVVFRDATLRRATIRVELSWLEGLLYRIRAAAWRAPRSWNDTVIGSGAAVGELTWRSEGTDTRIENPRIVDAIERERTRVAAWRRLTVIARHT